MRAAISTSPVCSYECQTGKAPYDARSPIALIGKILQGGAPPPDRHVGNVPKPLSAVVMLLLAKDADERVQSAAA